MLNYLGPNIGASPITQQLPTGTPGTMPGAVPTPAPPQPPAPILHHGHGGHAGHGHTPASALAAILKAPGGLQAAAPPPPPEYAALTQEDGSILLHVKNPDGSLGPAVKIVPPIKPSGSAAPK